MDLFPSTRETPLPGIPAPGGEVATAGERFVAQVKLAALRNDANFNAQRERDRIERELANQVIARIPRERLGEGPNAAFTQEEILNIAREMAAETPDAFADVDLSPEAIETRLNETLKEQRDELEQIVAMSPEGGAISEFIANMIGTTADIKNAPFLLLGGGGSVMRVMAREAMLNMMAEGINMPQRFDIAERLEEPAPNVLSELAAAAAFGGILGGGAAALARGVQIYMGRGRPPAGRPQTPDEEARINAVEDRIATDTPVAVVEEAIERAERVRPTRDPDLPTEPPDIPAQAQDTPPQEAPEPTAPRNEPAEEQQRLSDLLERETRRLEKQEPHLRRKAPFTQAIIDRQGGIRFRRETPRGRELTFAGAELQSRGITPKTHPFLFRKGGDGDLDTIVASEIFDEVGVFPSDPSSGFLLPGDVIDTIAEELGGGQRTFTTRAAREADQELESIREGLREAERNAENIAELDDFLKTSAARITPDEREIVLQEMNENGLDPVDAFERMAIRSERDRLPERIQNDPDFDDIPFPVPDRADDTQAGTGPRGGSPDARAAGERGEVARSADGGARFEETAAGQQQLIPDVDPITARDRLQDQAGRVLDGGDAPMDIGLVDTNARLQQDMFSEPSGKTAVDSNRAALDDLRASVERGEGFDGIDLDMRTDDGRVINSVSDLLRYAEDGVEFSEIINLCGRRT